MILALCGNNRAKRSLCGRLKSVSSTVRIGSSVAVSHLFAAYRSEDVFKINYHTEPLGLSLVLSC